MQLVEMFLSILFSCDGVLVSRQLYNLHVVSVGQFVGEEEVVEGMGTGGADELAQLNPSGHV